MGLTVGITGGWLIFLFIRYHLSTDRYHAKFDRIYRIVSDLHLDDGSVEYEPEAPLPMSAEMRRSFPQVEQAAFLIMNRSLIISVHRPGRATPIRFQEHDSTALTEAGLFQIFDYHWLNGNQQTALCEPNSVVLLESWARRYFSSTNPIDQAIELNHGIYATVTGVVADPTQPTDTHIGLFIAMPTIRQLYPDYDVNAWSQLSSTNRLYFTLKDTALTTPDQVEAALPALSKTHFGETAHVIQFYSQPLADVHFDVQRTGGVIRLSLLWSVGLIGLFLVLITCINFVNLATAQAFRRSKEVGIRKTMGSSRRHLAGQFLLETSLLVETAMVLVVL